MALGPRVVIAGTHSGVGKTTVATGLLAALRRAGHRPAGAKVGPDFIDPGYHSLACGRPPRNLDAWLCGPDAIPGLAQRAGRGADILVVEGVMGLFDGAADGRASSTAAVAQLIDAPVILVVDCAALSGSVAAVVHGYATWDAGRAGGPGQPAPGVRAKEAGRGGQLGGVILNRVGSPTHEALLREAVALTGVPVLGALPRDPAMTWRDRHLGLVPVVEDPTAVAGALDRLADQVVAGVDLAAVVALARTAPTTPADEPDLPEPGPPIRVGVAGGAAFSFTYADTLDALVAAGAEIVPFDPLTDSRLPTPLDGLIVGGGFPEAHLDALGANRSLLADLAAQVGGGLPTWAECAGLLLLSASLDGTPMAGVLPGEARMTSGLTLGYRSASMRVGSWLGPPGTAWRGHELHYSTLEPGGDAVALTSRWGQRHEGWATATLLATYVHHHPGGNPGPVAAFARACAGEPGAP
jgi:cobyrinic acid a,c-diamide synthase